MSVLLLLFCSPGRIHGLMGGGISISPFRFMVGVLFCVLVACVLALLLLGIEYPPSRFSGGMSEELLVGVLSLSTAVGFAARVTFGCIARWILTESFFSSCSSPDLGGLSPARSTFRSPVSACRGNFPKFPPAFESRAGGGETSRFGACGKTSRFSDF